MAVYPPTRKYGTSTLRARGRHDFCSVHWLQLPSAGSNLNRSFQETDMNPIKRGELSQHKHRITHLESEANYTFVHFVDQPRLLFSSTISSFHYILPTFLRIHRKYAINPDFAFRIQTKLGKPCVLLHTHCLPISRRLLKDVRYVLANPSLVKAQPNPFKSPKSSK